ncbi:hypothetical protein SAMN05660772_00280 [Pasteurella testudinis DSM 23072]|uniref:Type IV pilus biogenesis protein PilP n=1 Tax=Pasteurella testudinis DSM 23072 TaxID=1122938 RepID=A0A1W1UD06_9PAST|nr:hypothetical protein [Pasteurella testudinis]SMB78978.1 hypothetical protein SAMN05660772_00280 [Pasteurella testudinis DSM 23072]SUB52443.1 Uncharacterised protein [Pasteurella testudinis]
MQLFKSKIAAVGALLLGVFSFNATAQDKDYQYYENAKIAVNYNGEVGYLLQKIADQMKVGYLSYNADSAQPIVIKQAETQTLKDLLNSVNGQLKGNTAQFDTLGNRTLLVLSDGKEPIVQQYIGPVIFGSEQPPQNSIQVTLPETEKGETSGAVETSDNAAEEQLSEADQKLRDKETKIIDAIIQESADEKVLAKYKKKKAPEYRALPNTPLLGLEDIKSTPISTFLLFSPEVNTGEYSVKGPFEKIGKWGSVIAISHKTWKAPVEIRVFNQEKEELRLLKK